MIRRSCRFLPVGPVTIAAPDSFRNESNRSSAPFAASSLPRTIPPSTTAPAAGLLPSTPSDPADKTAIRSEGRSRSALYRANCRFRPPTPLFLCSATLGRQMYRHLARRDQANTAMLQPQSLQALKQIILRRHDSPSHHNYCPQRHGSLCALLLHGLLPLDRPTTAANTSQESICTAPQLWNQARRTPMQAHPAVPK
jgi:hypothetical protein